MIKKSAFITLVVALSLIFVVPAFAAAPNFGSAIYADGETWGTKGTADLPAPTEANRQSFDGLFVFTNGVMGQLPVAEAAPGNTAYNGGRWIAYSVEFVDEADAVLVTSYAQLHAMKEAGIVTVAETGNYFQCPLLPDKSG
jgi:hypothetical protein